MPYAYRIALHTIVCDFALPEMEALGAKEDNHIHRQSFPTVGSPSLIARAQGWVASQQRNVNVYQTKDGFALDVEACGTYFVAANGKIVGKKNAGAPVTPADRSVILGTAIVLALALQNIWSLHASAVIHNKTLFAFVGESGQGKSTLAANLSKSAEWTLAADDILPIKMENNEVIAMPHFPQLKLPAEEQPCRSLPEALPLTVLCLLEKADENAEPALQPLKASQTALALMGNIAGTRMFNGSLLEQHLQFCAQAAPHLTAFKLTYPHRRSALTKIQELLQTYDHA